MSYETKSYLIEFFAKGSGTPEYEDYMGQDAYEAVAEFRDNHPYATLQNVCLILSDFVELDDDTYDEYGVNTKNSFNTPPKESV